ncbi:MAG: AI-2E family transporter [Chloroflexia bacterium]|nr:AI-2E family transporter [Chloroflexia bacterium]
MQSIRFSPRAKTITIWILLILSVLFLYRVRAVASIFFWAIVAAYIFHPIIRFLSQRTRIPRVWWIILLYLLMGAIVYWSIAVLVPVVSRQYDDLLEAAPQIVNDIQRFIQENSLVEIYGYTLNLEILAEEISSVLGDLARNLPEQALAGVSLFFETAARGAVFLIATFYFLLHGEQWAERAFSLLPPHVRLEMRPLIAHIHTALTAYIRGQLLLIAIMSGLTYIILAILGVRFALVLALMAGVMDLVPFLGPIMAGGIAGLVVLFQPHVAFGWSNLFMAVIVVVIYTVLQQLENNLIIPNLVGYMVDLPPLLVIFVVLAGGTLAGPLGLLVAIPLAATLKIVFRYLYAKLMDKPIVFEQPPRPRQSRRNGWWRKKESSQ